MITVKSDYDLGSSYYCYCHAYDSNCACDDDDASGVVYALW